MTERVSDASSSFSLNSSLCETEDDQTIASILAEEEGSNAALNGNGRLAKRLSHLDSIPHTPRVVGEIPDASKASLDHERLSERLATYHLEELQIEGDGNCQFRAVADQLFHNSDHHRAVRKEVIRQLKHHKTLYEGYIPMKYRDYLKKMKKSGEWGDHITLQAAADNEKAVNYSHSIIQMIKQVESARRKRLCTLKRRFPPDCWRVKICLVTSFRDTGYIEIIPNGGTPKQDLWLSFWSEVHYNSLYDGGDVPSQKPRKKHWLF